MSAAKVPLYGLAFSIGNLIGPLLLGPLFDTVGRKKMISGTYILSGVLLAISGWLFDKNDPTAESQNLRRTRQRLTGHSRLHRPRTASPAA